MDNLGDWIYILIIIIAVVYKIVAGLPKKDVSEEAKPFQIPGQKFDWEEIFKEEKTPQESPVVQHPKKQKTVLDQVVLPESVDRRMKKTVPIIKKDTYNEESEGVEILNDPDDLRKAIIASEILARKF